MYTDIFPHYRRRIQEALEHVLLQVAYPTLSSPSFYRPSGCLYACACNVAMVFFNDTCPVVKYVFLVLLETDRKTHRLNLSIGRMSDFSIATSMFVRIVLHNSSLLITSSGICRLFHRYIQ